MRAKSQAVDSPQLTGVSADQRSTKQSVSTEIRELEKAISAKAQSQAVDSTEQELAARQ